MNNPITALQALLPACRLLRPSLGDSPLCLVAQAHILVSLYRLLSVAGLEPECGMRAEYVRRCDELAACIADKILYGKDNLADRFLLTDTLYFLITETGTCYDASRMNRCHDLLIGLMEGNESFLMAPDACRIEPALARCLEAYFYPQLDADDAWTGLLHVIFARWCASFSSDKGWTDVPDDLAWQRMETLNRYSYLFLDDTYDAVVRQAYAVYTRRMQVADISTTALYTCYQAMSQGHLLAGGDALAVYEAAVLRQRLSRYPAGSAEFCCCLAVCVEQLCHTILLDCRKEAMCCTA